MAASGAIFLNTELGSVPGANETMLPILTAINCQQSVVAMARVLAVLRSSEIVMAPVTTGAGSCSREEAEWFSVRCPFPFRFILNTIERDTK